MSKSKKRQISRTVDLDNVVFDGDLVLKLTYIVSQSRKDSEPQNRYYNDADFLERAVESAVSSWEDNNHQINIAPSGLSVIAPVQD